MSLKNKTAIVTGAAKGIGKGIALALAKEGCNVVISDIDQKEAEAVAEEVQKMGPKALAVRCDVSNKEEVEEKSPRIFFGEIESNPPSCIFHPFPLSNRTICQ